MFDTYMQITIEAMVIVFELKYINQKLKTIANMVTNSLHVHVNLIIFIAIIWL